ncbi:MAG: ATP-binding cassette domain-containing protein, partial [bacterium]
MKKIIEIKGLNKRFRKLKVFEDYSETISNGINLLLGDNGSGKTTLLNHIGFLDKKYKGKIIRKKEEEIIDEKTFFNISGFLPQEYKLPGHVKLLDFMNFLGEIGYIEEYEKKIEELLDRFDLTVKKKVKISELSGGMKQRVGIISVLLKEPEFILLDEPLKNVGEIERRHFLEYITEYNRKHEPLILISTNIPNEYESIDC